MNFYYDGLNRQIARYGTALPATFSVWNGWDLYAEYGYQALVGSPIRTTIHGGPGDLVSQITTGVSTTHYYPDGLGSTAYLASAGGAVVEQYTYDAYGTPTIYNAGGTVIGASAYSADHFFTGRQWHAALGLYDNRHRFYAPDWGRFLQPDPIGFAGDSANLYRYVGNNPANWSDPTGLYAGVDDAAFALGGAVVGVFGQGVHDFWSGQLSGWQAYTGAAIGGAIGGVTVEYAGPVAAGIAGAAASDLATQGLQIASGNQQQLNLQSTAIAAVIGGLTGRIGSPRVPGLNSGRNSYNAIFNQMRTKFQNGTIGRVTPRTAAKMAAGRLHATGAISGTFTGSTLGLFASLPANPAAPAAPEQSLPEVDVNVNQTTEGTQVTYGDPDGALGSLQVVDPDPPLAAHDE